MNKPIAPTRPIDLTESAAGEEDPGAGIVLPGTCPLCGGSGTLAGRECPTCQGTGKVPAGASVP